MTGTTSRRALKLSAEQRSEIARKAAAARWQRPLRPKIRYRTAASSLRL
jgi:hypothetical protein